jgi:oligosaccharide 4-alpha-D-glucosyltransferase
MTFGCSQMQEQTYVNDTVRVPLPDGGYYYFQALTDDIFKVQFVKDSASDLQYAPVLNEPIPLKVLQSSDQIILSTESVTVEIALDPFVVSYSDSDGQLKTQDLGGLVQSGDSTFYRFKLTEDESIYGTGFRALPLDRRGHRLLVYNRPQYGYGWGEENLNYTIPHWSSSQQYGLLIDNPARAFIDLGKAQADEISYSSAGGNLTYYFINGASQKELLSEYTLLTGRQPLPPRWAFGHLQSRFGYRNQKETEQILAKAKGAGYPVDAIILDIYWFGPELEDGQMGRLDWDREKWPTPKEMIASFAAQDVETIVVTEPFFTRKSSHYTYLSDNKLLALDSVGNTYDIPDFYFGAGGLLDIFKPAAKEWIWDQYKYIRSFGVSGLWVDLGEPEKHPHDMMHFNGPAHKIHGAYGHAWAEMLYQGYRIDYPTERLFHMGRSGFAGSQRFGLIPWTGDVNRGWSGLRAQTPAILSMGLSGLGYMHSDAGGFSMTDNADDELYIRWIQLAIFTSIFRPHADAMVAPEPVFWPAETQKIVKRYIDLRYSLLPYHYALAYENAQTGLPFARPMFLEFEEVSDGDDQQFMYGSSLLIAPVVEAGASSKDVLMPKGDWYDYWTGRLYEGGGKTSIPVTMDNIPVFAKAGQIVATSPGTNHAGNYTGETLTLTYFVGDEGAETTLFFDDGVSPSTLVKNAYEVLKITSSIAEGRYTFTTHRSGQYNGQPEVRMLTFKVVGLTEKPVELPKEATWDGSTGILWYHVTLADADEWSFTKQ